MEKGGDEIQKRKRSSSQKKAMNESVIFEEEESPRVRSPFKVKGASGDENCSKIRKNQGKLLNARFSN